MLHALTDRIWYSDFVSRGDRPALGLVRGDEACLVVDGGNSPAQAGEFLSLVPSGLPPLRWLAVTHWHWDHVFGADTFGLPLVCRRGTGEKLRWMQGLSWTDDAIAARVADGSEIPFCQEHITLEFPPNDREIRVPSPHFMLDGPAWINLGGLEVHLLPVEADHTDDCLVVHIPDEGVVFLGDSVYMRMQEEPWSYSSQGILPLMERLAELEAQWYVPSHGPVWSRDGFLRFKDFLTRMAGVVGDGEDPEALLGALRRGGREPSPMEKEYLEAFAAGNRKKKLWEASKR